MRKSLFLYVLLSVCTLISAQRTRNIGNGQFVIYSCTSNDSVIISSAVADGKNAIYLSDSLFNYNGKLEIQTKLSEGETKEDYILKIMPSVRKDEDGKYVHKNGKIITPEEIEKILNIAGTIDSIYNRENLIIKIY